MNLVAHLDGVAINLGVAPQIAVEARDRQALLDLLSEVKKDRVDGCFQIDMDCGYSRVFKEEEDIPHEDLPCPCDNAEHYLIKYVGLKGE